MSKKRELSQITELIIHCAATPNGRYFTATDIDDWHSPRGFTRHPDFITAEYPLKHIGYHFVIGITGIEFGRCLNETGAHARGHNTASIGICLIGTDQFSQAQWLELKQLVDSLLNRFPQLKILGHREINAHKTCPGFDINAWLVGHKAPLNNHLYTDLTEL